MLGNKTRVPRQPYLSFPPHGASSLVEKSIDRYGVGIVCRSPYILVVFGF